MFLQSVHIRRKTVLRVGLFFLKVLVFLPFSLIAQTRSNAFAMIPMTSATAASALNASGQHSADVVPVTNDRPDRT